MKKGNMTVFASVFVIALVALGVGMGTVAYFSDTDAASNNVLTAGTLTTSLSAGSGYQEDELLYTWSVADWAPGETVEATISVKNTGTIAINYINIKPLITSDIYGLCDYINIVEFDIVKAGTPLPDMHVWMATMSFWGGTPPLTLAEWAYETDEAYGFQTGPEDGPGGTGGELEPQEVMTIYLKLEFDFSAPDGLQGKTATFDLRILSTQHAAHHIVGTPP